MDYYLHPEKLKPGIYYAHAQIFFENGDGTPTTDRKIPLGRIESKTINDEEKLHFGLEVATKSDLYDNIVNDGTANSPWYSDDWTTSTPSVLSVSEVGNGYKM